MEVGERNFAPPEASNSIFARQGARRVWADSKGRIWVSDFGANALVRFDPEPGTFRTFLLPSKGARVRQLLGRKGEVWGAESGTDRLVVIRFPQAAPLERHQYTLSIWRESIP